MCPSQSAVAAVALAAALLCGAALAQSSLEYRNRGNRFEGVRALPVSGYTIELLSFRAAYDEPLPAERHPARYRMRFFLEKPVPAYVTVREVKNTHCYWLDNVRPPKPWGPGFANYFEWSTRDVIDQLPGLKLYDLGVTVRVGNANPSDVERIAPVILYHSTLPGTVSGYELAFKTNATARLEFSVERADGSPVVPAPKPTIVQKWSYGEPLLVSWDASKAGAGEYRLQVRGRVLENNQTFGKEIRFFHQPNVR